MTVRLLSNPHVPMSQTARRVKGTSVPKAEGVQSNEPAGSMPVQGKQSDSYSTGAAYCVGSLMVRAWAAWSIGNPKRRRPSSASPGNGGKR
jgi:hypothetical protein